jgi:hypothetical protein
MREPFLTDLDSRAAVKGSRDPLGIQPIWTRFGRHVVGNLTTVSNSVRDFTVLILGYHFAEQVAQTAGPESELGTFLKWEQLAAYARASINRETGFRGTERVWRNLKEGAVVLSASTRNQILSNQKVYGLWGLFTVPGRSSGLLEGLPTRLTPPARELVEGCYLPKLEGAHAKGRKGIAEILAREKTPLDVDGDHRKLLAAVAGLLSPKVTPQESTFYKEHLVFGGPKDRTEGLQRQLATLLEPFLAEADFKWSPLSLRALAKEAERRGEAWSRLASRLHRIAVVETVLAPASDLYGYLLGCHEVPTTELAKRLRRAWGSSVSTVASDEIPALRAELGAGDDTVGERWLAIADAMSHGDYVRLIQLLLAQNRAVMQLRGGATAWIDEQNGRLHVRVADERGDLPERKELPSLWRFPYFLDSLMMIAGQLKEGRDA